MAATGAPDGTKGLDGPSRTRRRIVWAVVLAAVAGTGLLLGVHHSVPSASGRALSSLPSGTCFEFTDPTQRTDVPIKVRTEPCRGRHQGEVVDQVVLDGSLIHIEADVPAQAPALCGEPFARYNPDAWAPPVNVVLTMLPEPPKTDPNGDGGRRVVTCFYLAENYMVTGTLHGDPARLTAAQQRYLDAVRPYDVASGAGLDLNEHARGSDLTDWAGRMAEAEQRTLADLRQVGPPAGAEQPFAAVLEHHDAAVAAWRAAAADARAADTAAMKPDRAVRAALGLTTEMRPRGYSL